MDINKHLNEFCYYFTRYFEEQMRYWRHILEENPDIRKKPSSKAVSIISAMTSAIPTVGKGIGGGIIEGEKYVNSLIDKKNASKVGSIAYTSGDEKDSFRNILISGALDVFTCFEYQFTKVTCENGGSTRAMQKLGQDGANRLFTYLLNEESVGDLTPELVQKGILYGNSRRHNTKVLKLGRTLHTIEDKTKVTTSYFFVNCGLRVKQDDVFTYYRKKKASSPILGHRILFSFEDSQLGDSYEIESPNYFYNYTLTEMDKEEVKNSIWLYISKKDPLEDIKEFAKFSYEEQLRLLEAASAERLKIREDILEDNAVRHIEVKETIESSQTAIVTRLETALAENTSLILSQTDRVLQKNEELSKDVAVIKQKQEEEKTTSDDGKVVVIDLEGIKEEGRRLGKNIEREGKKVEKEIRRARDRIKKFRF